MSSLNLSFAYSLSFEQFSSFLVEQGVSACHAKPIYQSIYGRLGKPSQIPKGINLDRLESFLEPIAVTRQFLSDDGSVKMILKANDGGLFESVLMPETNRFTVCVSSQIGCRQACRFCHTGRMGLLRSLTTEEIVFQVILAARYLKQNDSYQKNHPNRQITNVVFMGMGEPLDNVEALTQSVKIMASHNGLNIALKRITVSTAGHLDGMKAWVDKGLGTGFALSVHHPDSEKRSKLLPINRRYPIHEVISYLKSAQEMKKMGTVLIQYTMIKDQNDSLEDARQLVELIKGLKVKVNLIPLNGASRSYVSSHQERLEEFRTILADSKIVNMIRYSKGQDINGACGQLVTKTIQKMTLSSVENRF